MVIYLSCSIRLPSKILMNWAWSFDSSKRYGFADVNGCSGGLGGAENPLCGKKITKIITTKMFSKIIFSFFLKFNNYNNEE